MCPSANFKINQFYKLTLPTKVSFLDVLEARWTETVINLCVEYFLIPTIDSLIHHEYFHLSDYMPILFMLLEFDSSTGVNLLPH